MSRTQKRGQLRIFYSKNVHFDYDFIDGLLSIFGIEITEDKPRTRQDDTRAIASDWEKIGQDIRHSMEVYSRENALV